MPEELLFTISSAFSNKEECIRLARKLKFGLDYLDVLLDATFSSKLALEVMQKWMSDLDEQAAVGPTLLSALQYTNRQTLADPFEDRLLGKGEEFKQQV